MSLYNMVCGNNPLFQLFLAIVKVPFEIIPRFRDLYLVLENGKPLVVIYTRTGGGNRGAYLEANGALAAHPNYFKDCDDDFDSTFAHWYFHVPPEREKIVARLAELLNLHPQFTTPARKFKMSMGEELEWRQWTPEEAYEAGCLTADLYQAYGPFEPPPKGK